MNAYYENNGRINSNSGNIRSNFTRTANGAQGARAAMEQPLFWLLRLLAFLANPTVRRVARVTLFACVFAGFIGVIGAMQNGNLGLGTGVLIGSLLLAVEYLCLRQKKATGNR